MPACFLTYATTKFEAEISDIEKFHVFHDYATRKGMVKPHENKSIQYMKLVYFYFGVVYIYQFDNS